MKSSRRVQSFMEPIPQGKRARLEGAMGTAAPPGLSTADSLTPYSQDKSLAYRQHYLPCPLSRQDITSWSPTRILVRNGGSPVIHPSSTSGSITNPVFYRPENVTFPVDSCTSTEAEVLAAKHKFSYCNRSPSEHSPSSAGLVSSVAFKKIPISCTSVSPSATENSVGIAIPKPVYGHSPYCSEQKCTLGLNYAKERGLQRVPPQILETDLMTYHDHLAYLNKKESETLMLQRHLSFDQCREGALLKDVVTDGYYDFTPTRPTLISAFSKPSPVSSFVTSPPESSQHFQMPTQTHKDLTPMYEALTGVQYGGQLRVYQDCPLISKYGAIAQHSRLSCPKNNTNNTYRPENSLITDKQRGPFHIHQPCFGDLPNPLTRLSPGHLGVSNVPAYTTYRMPINTSTMDTITKTPFCLHVMQQGDRPLDFSMRRDPTADSYKTSGGQPGILGPCHETESQVHLRAHAVSNNAENTNSNVLLDQGQDCWPISSHDHTNSPRCTDKIVNEKQSVKDSGKSDDAALSSKGHREGRNGSSETDSLGKAHKMDNQKSNDIYLPSSPQMPVINSVFSLAPYKAYLEAAGVLSSAGNSECLKLEPDSKPMKEDQKTQNTAQKPNLPQDELHLEAVKKSTACNHGSNYEKLINLKKEDSYQSEINKSPTPVFCHKDDANIKEHTDFEDKADAQHNHVLKNGFEQECELLTPEIPDQSSQHNHKCSVLDKLESVPPDKDSDPPGSMSSTPPIIPQATVSISKIPQHCLKLTSYKIILPEDLKTPLVPEFHQSPVEVKPKVSSRQARHKFMELHQSLCRLVTDSIFHSTHCELRNWLSRLDLAKPVSPPVKTQVSCLLGSKAREVWMKGEETVTALQNVLCQLERYLKNHECPFPHVIRAGAVFIPMLVVKEILFPQVQGTFVDQVLQEHRVELRPTTLSEERQLTQLHKRAFSSKLRRLLSLKYLTDIYPDVLTLLYYASVCKFLGEVEVNIAFKEESVECLDNPESSDKVLEISPRPFTPDGSTYQENLEQNSCHKRYKSKGRVKSACRRMFLGEATSPAEEEHDESEFWSCADSLGGEGWEHIPEACSNEEGHIEVRIKEDTKQELEDFWGQPLTTDDLSSESTDMETEMESWSLRPSCSSGNTERPSFSNSHSDMVLKLRKVCYNRDSQGQVSHYQRVPEQSKAHRGGGKHKGRHRKKKNRSSESTMQCTHSSAKSKHSVHPPTHCASKQKRWLLRSAVQNAHRSMRKSYPDLLGKRIRHLYEETDKTEVWYKGVVVRIHEPHPNPLKTVFEVKYDSEPEWQYYLELLMDYKKGWLQIED